MSKQSSKSSLPPQITLNQLNNTSRNWRKTWRYMSKNAKNKEIKASKLKDCSSLPVLKAPLRLGTCLNLIKMINIQPPMGAHFALVCLMTLSLSHIGNLNIIHSCIFFWPSNQTASFRFGTAMRWLISLWNTTRTMLRNAKKISANRTSQRGNSTLS